MATCTIFRNFSIPIEKRSLILISKDIASDKFKAQVEKIRSLVAEGKFEEANELKKQLLAFTPSAVFTEKRQLAYVDMYSQFIHLDFDKLSPEQLIRAKEIITQIPYTFLCFLSPSGNGLKVFVQVSTGMEHHDIAYLQIQQYYEEATGLNADPSCKDITRLCFMSYDPGLFKNIENKSFPVVTGEEQAPAETKATPQTSLTPVQQPSENEDLNETFIFNQQVLFTNRKISFQNGNRNNYVYLLASNCNRAGLPQSVSHSLITQHFDLPAKEIQTAVNSAYLHHAHEFNTVKLNPEEQQTTIAEEPMPTLPDGIFQSIPEYLKQITEVASSREERDVLLLGALVTLSIAFPKLLGKYGDNPVNANLFIFISAKASAGKGILIHCRKLVEPIHLMLREQAKLLKRQYDLEMQEYNASKGKGGNVEKPKKPPQKMLFIPANNSATGFLEILGDSDNRGIIFETEGDTLSKSFKSDYGDFSDGFRNAFQHEPISYYRRTDKEYVEILRPCLSALLSGTPKQIQVLIPNAENGLFSRFMFYVMNMKHEWKDVFAAKTENGLQEHFEQLGSQFFNLYQSLQASPEIRFSLTATQQQKFNEFFGKIQTLYIAVQEEDIISSVRRLGLTAYRIMMIFTALRIMETGEITPTLVCEDVDFENTLQMISVLIKHSSYVFTQIAEETHKPKPKNRKEKLLESLPANFNRQAYVAIALQLAIPDKTAQRYISELVNAGIILHDGHDNYTNPHASKTD